MNAFRAWHALNVQSSYMRYSSATGEEMSSTTGLQGVLRRPDLPCSEKRDESLAVLHLGLSIAPSVVALLICITQIIKLWGEVPKLQSRVWSFWKSVSEHVAMLLHLLLETRANMPRLRGPCMERRRSLC